MQATIDRIAKELTPFYPESEILGFTRLIFESVCGLSFTQLSLKQYRALTSVESAKIEEIVCRLKRFEPIQYILGETEFYGLKLKVTPAVLIPRQETEELVDWVLKSGITPNTQLLDIGTGSGCIAVLLKKQRPDLTVSAIDISEEVLAVARENAKTNLAEIRIFISDIFNPVELENEKYDVIVSNPPYVRESEKVWMNKNVLLYEPEKALFVPDSDPWRFYKAISEFAGRVLNPGGFLFLEINEAMGEKVSELLKEKFCNIELRDDLNGKNRMVKAQKS
jgi:release factor glutamine methyltransferase